ncbi:hypothetical protein ZWY2020_035262 [Hordeum vulgare]|nr:hypothetical protein ZWY2020_035262 [Hordeum vulgare]
MTLASRSRTTSSRTSTPTSPSPTSLTSASTSTTPSRPPSPTTSPPRPDSTHEAHGIVFYGTGAGITIFAADAVNTRSINASNVLALSGMATPPEAATAIVDGWLATPFRAPCPAWTAVLRSRCRAAAIA